MCGKIEKLSDRNKNWCGSRYGPHDYHSGGKNTKIQRDKKIKGKKTIRQKDKKTKRQKCKKTKRQKGLKRPEGPPCPPHELEQGGHRPPKF